MLDEIHAIVRRANWNRYPDRGATALRASVAARHGVHPEQVFVAASSNDVLQAAMLAYAGPGRHVRAGSPPNPIHLRTASVSGASVEGCDADELVRRPLSAHEGAETPTILVVDSPSGVTGAGTPLPVLAALLERHPDLVLVDETLGEFAERSAIEMVDEDRPLAVIRSCTRTIELAGLGFGYLIGPSALIDGLWSVTLPYHLDAIRQAVGALLLDHADELSVRAQVITAERRRLADELRMVPGVADVLPSDADFLIVRLGRGDARQVHEQLVHAGAATELCSHPSIPPNSLRIAVGTVETDDALLTALSAGLRDR